jgi:hypothetical protein
LRIWACCPFARRVALSRATGPAETKEEARTARKAKVKKAMREEYYRQPGRSRYCKPQARVEMGKMVKTGKEVEVK